MHKTWSENTPYTGEMACLILICVSLYCRYIQRSGTVCSRTHYIFLSEYYNVFWILKSKFYYYIVIPIF